MSAAEDARLWLTYDWSVDRQLEAWLGPRPRGPRGNVGLLPGWIATIVNDWRIFIRAEENAANDAGSPFRSRMPNFDLGRTIVACLRYVRAGEFVAPTRPKRARRERMRVLEMVLKTGGTGALVLYLNDHCAFTLPDPAEVFRVTRP